MSKHPYSGPLPVFPPISLMPAESNHRPSPRVKSKGTSLPQVTTSNSNSPTPDVATGGSGAPWDNQHDERSSTKASKGLAISSELLMTYSDGPSSPDTFLPRLGPAPVGHKSGVRGSIAFPKHFQAPAQLKSLTQLALAFPAPPPGTQNEDRASGSFRRKSVQPHQGHLPTTEEVISSRLSVDQLELSAMAVASSARRRSVPLHDLDISLLHRQSKLSSGPGQTMRFSESRIPESHRNRGSMMVPPEGLLQFENIVGFQGDLLELLGGGGAPTQGKANHAISRKALLLKVPTITEDFSLDVPALAEDKHGHSCLIVLPSDKPSTRGEAVAVEQLLVQLLRDPPNAAHKAALWRAQVLSTTCADALGSMSESMHGQLGPKPLAQSWRIKTVSSEETPRIGKESAPLAEAGPQGSSLEDIPMVLAGMNTDGKNNAAQLMGSNPRGSRTDTRVGEALADEAGVEDGPEGGVGATQQQLLDTLSVTVAATICMADIIRQVEVHCGERGRVLAYIWNAYLTTHENVMVGMKKENSRLLVSQRQLSGKVTELGTSVAEALFLRKEISRFRVQMSHSDSQIDKLLSNNLYMKQVVEDSEAALNKSEVFLDKSLARLRWMHAFYVIGTKGQRFALVSGGMGEKGKPDTVLRKVTMMEKLMTAVQGAARRKKMKAELADLTKHQSFADVVANALSEAQREKWNFGMDNRSLEEILKSLKNLHPEAAAIALLSMSDEKRWEVLVAMQPADRAKMLVVMSEDMRDLTKAALGVEEWRATLEAVGSSADLGAKLLQNFASWEAVREFEKWSPKQQALVANKLDAMGANEVLSSKVLTNASLETRTQLAHNLKPEVIARCLKHLDGEPIKEFFQGFTKYEKLAILRHMEASKVAAFLSCCGDDEAAALLASLHPKADEVMMWLQPKVAAGLVLLMEDIEQETPEASASAATAAALERGDKRVGFEGDKATEGAKEEGEQEKSSDTTKPTADTSEGALAENASADADRSQAKPESDPMESPRPKGGTGSQVLSSMAAKAVETIMGHMNFKDKADVLANLDPKQVAEILALMDASEAVMLLACMSDVSMAVIADALSPEDRERICSKLNDASRLAEGKPKMKKGDKGSKSVGKKSGGKKGGKLSISLTMNKKKKEELAESFELAVAKNLVEASDDEEEEDLANAASALLTPQESLSVVREDSYRVSSEALQASVSEVKSKLIKTINGNTSDQPASTRHRSSDAGNTKTAVMPSAFDGGIPGAGEEQEEEEGEEEQEVEEVAVPKPKSSVSKKEKKPKKIKGKAVPMKPVLEEEDDASVLAVEEVEEEEEEEGEAVESEDEQEGREEAEEEEGHEENEAASSKVQVKQGSRPSKAPAKARALKKIPSDRDRDSPASSKVKITLSNNVKKAVKKAIKEKPEGQQVVQAAVERLFQSPTGEQAKLGKLPKNQRLKDAMAQHSNAKPKPKGWILSVVEQIYKDAESVMKKLGRTEGMRKQSVAEIVFAYFFNKYGQKNVVNAYVGALVNTLTLYKTTDLNLEAFAKFLSEEWEFPAFLDFLQARSLAVLPANIVCIEYPKEAEKGEQYAWVDYHKAVWVSDIILGQRSTNVRARFIQQLMAGCSEVPEAEAEKFRQTKRSEGVPLPDVMYHMHRLRFLMVLIKESDRINTVINKMSEERFAKADSLHAGQVECILLHEGLASLLPPDVSPETFSSVVQEVTCLAEAYAKDIPATEVQVDKVELMERKAFVSSVLQNNPIRDYIKAELLQPAREVDEADEGELYKTYLTSVVVRHCTSMMPLFDDWLKEAGKEAAMQERIADLYKEVTGDGKFKAYMNLLAAIVNMQVQTVLDEVIGSEVDSESVDADKVELYVGRLEDLVIMMLHEDSYLIACSNFIATKRISRIPPASRIRTIGRDIKTHHSIGESIQSAAAFVFQNVWRQRKERRLAAAENAA